MFELGSVAQLAVSRRPDNRGARVKVGGLAVRTPYIVTVEPAHAGGWQVVVPDEPGPTRRPTFAAAFAAALALACAALAERAGALLSPRASGPEPVVAGPYDAC